MKQLVLAVVFTLAAVLVMVTPLWRSGVIDDQGNILFDTGAEFYDAGVHLSLIGEMQSRFPPTNFAAGGVPLKNYHYFYDTLLAAVVKATGVSYLDLYFRIAPVVLAALLSLMIYLTARELIKNRLAGAWAIFFTVFGTSLGVMTLRGTNNVFMTDQIYDMIVNPQGVLSLVIFLGLFLLLEKKRWLLFALLLAVSFGVKAHGGIVFAAGAFFAGLAYLKRREYTAVLMIGLGLAGMAGWVAVSLDKSAAGLQWAPGWLLERMVKDYERLYWVRGLNPLPALAVYLVGSLGLRVFGLAEWKRFPPFLLGAGLASFFIPLFFSQGKKPFDIVQFTPYFTLLAGIGFTAFIFRVFKKPAFILLASAAIFILLDKREILSRRSYLAADTGVVRMTENGPVRGDQPAIPAGLAAASGYLREHSAPGAIVLLPPSKYNLSSLWFTAVAWRRTVFAGEFFPYQVGVDTVKAKNHVAAEFGPEPVEPDFDYVFLRRPEVPEFGRIKDKYHLETVFENNEAVIYRHN